MPWGAAAATVAGAKQRDHVGCDCGAVNSRRLLTIGGSGVISGFLGVRLEQVPCDQLADSVQSPLDERHRRLHQVLHCLILIDDKVTL